MRNRLVAIDEMRLELKARRAGGEIDTNRYAEDDARYRDMQHDAELQLFQAQRVLNSAGDIDQVIGLLTDMGKSIDRLTPELKRKALQGLFAKKIINTAGEIVRLEPQAWIAQSLGELVWAWRHSHPAPDARDIPNMTPTGLDTAFGISPQAAWLPERIAA